MGCIFVVFNLFDNNKTNLTNLMLERIIMDRQLTRSSVLKQLTLSLL